MKKLLILFLLIVTIPLNALNAPTAPNQEPVLQVYSSNRDQNARNAVRLGYSNFRQRVNTPDMTPTDIQIALFINTKLQSFFNKVNLLENASGNQKVELKQDYSEEFVQLLQELSKAFLKNQNRYINSFLIDDQAALDETLHIVQQAIKKGHF